MSKNKYWTHLPDRNWYSLTRPIKEEVTIVEHEFKTLPAYEMVKILNDKSQRDMVHSHKMCGDNSFLVDFRTETTYTQEIDNSLPEVKLPPGIFTYEYDMQGWGLKPYEFNTDEFVELSDHTSAIEKDIETFLANKDKYHSNKLLHKRGILLIGPPGCGKTALLEQIARRFANRARIVFGPHLVFELKSFHEYMNDLPIIIILEEFTNYGDGSQMLSFLDGEESCDGTLLIATSNYPQRIPNNIIDRPGRFDGLYEVGLPDATTRRKYLENKLGTKLSDDIIKNTEGLSIAYLKELVIGSKVYDKSFEQVFNEFKDRKEKIKKYADMRNQKNSDLVWSPTVSSKLAMIEDDDEEDIDFIDDLEDEDSGN